MNGMDITLYFNWITAHQYLIIMLTKREMMFFITFSFHQQHILVEWLVRTYPAVIQSVYLLIHHFIKIIKVFPTVLSLPCRTCLFCVSVNSGSHVCNLPDRWCR